MGLAEALHRLGGNSLDARQRGRRRRLILQDAAALLSLAGITLALAVVTYFFFYSFRAHRQVLESRWFARGQQDLATGRAQDAVEAFRSALTLSSGNRAYELALAQALADAGRIDEAYAYYSTLLEAKPGDGLLNLRMARLAVRKNYPAEAIALYQAALNGDWLDEGVLRRREVRLELAQYLILQHMPTRAQAELLTAEGNALENSAVMNQIAALLDQAHFLKDALTAYQRAQQHAPSNSPEMLQAFLGEGRVAESLGEYKIARHALERYLIHARQVSSPPEDTSIVEAWFDQLQRMQALDPLPSLPPRQRAQRLLADGSIARHRLRACIAQQSTAAQSTQDAATLAILNSEWKTFPSLRLSQLADDQQKQDSLASLIDQTEIWANQRCGAPTGDDALLLQLATVPNRTE